MRKYSLIVLALAALAPLRPATPPSLTPAQRAHEQILFRRVFGEKVAAFDPAAFAQVKRLSPGERLKLDTNGDGKIDTIYFIDTDPKHQPEFRPILVKVIDQDGDMDRDGDGDLDSDLYLADWHADGSIDAAVEYRDTNHDNGLDEMGIYTYSANNARLGTDAIQVWWSRDIAGTHQLWETVNYRYQQPECQFRTAFGGDEIFSSYIFDSKNGRWIPSWENPFAFYDEDGDHLAEVAIRFSGSAERMESMRYSFDADNDTDGDNVHDYDFSFSCLTAGHSVTVPRALMETVHLRGGPVAPLLSWRNARRFGESADWGKVQLTWVENDNNVDSRPGGDPHERWEGVIASGTKDFPQVGGPPVGLFNSRYEADLDNSGKMKLYYSPEDRRIHLRGADTGSLKVDYNYDGKLDMDFEYRDTDHDGIFDTWTVDVDGDGVADRTVHIPHPRAQPVPLHYQSLTAFYNRSLHQALAENKILIGAMKNILAPDAIESYYTNQLATKIRDSRAGTRYYQDLIRERYFVRLKKALEGRPELWSRLEAEYDAGNFSQTAKLLSEALPAHESKTTDWPSSFTKRLPLYVSNPGSSARMAEPIVLDVSAIRKQAPDFNPNNFIVQTGAAWIAPRELPSQADLDQIVFLTDLRANEEAKYWIYYSPTGERKKPYAPSAVAPSGSLGELAIWDSGKRYPITKRSDRILASGPVRSIIEATEHSRYDIRQRFSVYRGIRYTEVSVRIQSPIQFSLSFPKFPNDRYFFDPTRGYFASWGRQNNIVQEVGEAAIFTKPATLKETATQRELIFTAKPGETITYYLTGDQRRSRMFPVAPTAANWQEEIRALAVRLHAPVQSRIGNAESR
ncbi:MAG TPA: DUF4861 family protein [Bryobacteraceae bacterium]